LLYSARHQKSARASTYKMNGRTIAGSGFHEIGRPRRRASRNNSASKLFVAKRDHGIEATGAEGGDVAGGGGDEGESGGGKRERQRVVGRKAKELALDYAGKREGSDDAGGYTDGHEKQDFAHDHPDDVTASGAESHANADFASALRNSVGHDAVETDDGEERGEESEYGGEAGDHALGRKGVVDLHFGGAHGVDG
jgi:hypothetical protein